MCGVHGCSRQPCTPNYYPFSGVSHVYKHITHVLFEIWGCILCPIILQLQDITKIFPGVKALSEVTFSVQRGHVHALVGENGAGKSTLIKVICGVYPYGTYEGKVFFEGKECKFKTIRDVEKAGIACIHQEPGAGYVDQ